MKLHFSTPSFKSFNEGKTTLCVYQCAIVDNTNNVLKTFKASGKAVLSDTDVYDETIARHLADSRAKEKAYDAVARMMPFSTLETELKNAEDALNILRFYKKMYRLRRNERKHIKTIV